MTTEIDDLPLTAQQRRNRANQMPQTGINPADGIANLAGDIGAGVQAGAESVQRGVAQQGRAYQTVGSYLNNGDPVGDAARGIADLAGQAWDGTKRFFKESADAARTSSYGLDPDPRMSGTPIQAIAQPTQRAVAQVSNPAMPPQVQPAPAAQAPHPVIPGISGGSSANITQASTAGVARQSIPAPAPSQVSGIADGIPTFSTKPMNAPTEKTNSEKYSDMAIDLLSKSGSPFGTLVAMKMLAGAGRGAAAIEKNNADVRAGIAGANDASRKTDIAAFSATSQDQDRRTDNAIKADTLEEKKRQNAMREELAGLNDENDPGGKKRAALSAKLRALAGHGGQEKDHMQSVMVKDDMGRETPMVFNKATGQYLDQYGKPLQPAPQYVVGQVYQDANGNKAKWNGTGWTAQ